VFILHATTVFGIWVQPNVKNGGYMWN